MNRLDRLFAETGVTGRKALMPFFMAGDPDLKTTAELGREAFRQGADILEIGFPFSDPLADGPTIQRSAERALAAGVRLRQIWELAANWRQEGFEQPLVLLTYYNPLLRHGLENAAREAAAAGIDALVVPDLSLEESGPLREELESRGLYLIPFLAPTTPDERIKEVMAVAKGFIYCVALTGVTGVRQGPSAQARPLLERARRFGTVPLAVGFGISGPAAAREMAQWADAIIIGSAMIERATSGGASEVGTFIAEVRAALD